MVQPGLEAFECMKCFTAVCVKCIFIRLETERRTWSLLLQSVCVTQQLLTMLVSWPLVGCCFIFGVNKIPPCAPGPLWCNMWPRVAVKLTDWLKHTWRGFAIFSLLLFSSSFLMFFICEAHFQVFISRLLCVACAHRHTCLMIHGRIWLPHNYTRTCVRSATLCGISPFYVIFVWLVWRKFFKWKYFYFCFHISYVGFKTETNDWFLWGYFVCSGFRIIFLLCYCVEFCSVNAPLWMNKKKKII